LIVELWNLSGITKVVFKLNISFVAQFQQALPRLASERIPLKHVARREVYREKVIVVDAMVLGGDVASL
jgi:hypothetical protein